MNWSLCTHGNLQLRTVHADPDDPYYSRLIGSLSKPRLVIKNMTLNCSGENRVSCAKPMICNGVRTKEVNHRIRQYTDAHRQNARRISSFFESFLNQERAPFFAMMTHRNRNEWNKGEECPLTRIFTHCKTSSDQSRRENTRQGRPLLETSTYRNATRFGALPAA